MPETPEVQVFIKITFSILLGFAVFIAYLLVKLMINQRKLIDAQEQLTQYADGLEHLVEERTTDLSLSEALYRSLFEQLREAVFLVDRDTLEIQAFNSQAMKLCGFSEELLSGMKFDQLLGSNTDDVLRQEQCECVFEKEDGSICLLDISVGLVYFKGKSCYQVVCRDVTERRSMEAQKIQNEKMISLGLLAAGIAHELKNPLGVIYNSLYYLKQVLKDLPEKAIKHMGFMENQIDLCRNIINDMYAFLSGEKKVDEIYDTDLNHTINQCLELLEGTLLEKEIILHKELSELPPYPISTGDLTQVINNIVYNSMQAMPEGGELRVKTNLEKSNHLSEGISTPKNLVISISDTGVGMDEATLANIFTPFYKGKLSSGKIGMGLWVSYNIVKRYSGEIKVLSAPGKGTTFKVLFPMEKIDG